VTALDASNNTSTGYTGTVHFTSNDSFSGLPADYTFVAADAGIHTFTGSVILRLQGNEGVTVADTATGSISGTATVMVTLGETDGPRVSGVTDTTAIVFARTSSAAAVAVQYSTDPTLATFSQTAATTTSSLTDFTTSANLTGLQPLTRYYYRVLVNGVAQQSGTLPSFTTFPTPGTAQDFSFGVVSDLASVGWTDPPAPAYASLAADKPAFFLQIGDFDHRTPNTLSSMQQMDRNVTGYYGNGGGSGGQFTRYLASQFPFDHVFDDHDSGTNDDNKTSATHPLALETYQEYYPTYALAAPDLGIQHTFTYGDAQFFMLDMRSERDVNTMPDGPDKSILGSVQEQWLEQGLLNSTAKWKFIVSSVALNQTAGSDGWTLFHTSWVNLTNFINQNQISGVIAISGDTHSFGKIDDGANSGVVELGVPATNLASFNATELGTWDQGAVSVDSQQGGYALVTVSMTSNQVLLQAKRPDGSVRLSYTVHPSTFNQPATHLGVSVFPEFLQGIPLTVYVTAQDALNNLAPGYTDTVHFKSTDPHAVLPADYTFTAADDGRHFFSISMPTVGNSTLTVTDTANTSISGSAQEVARRPTTQLNVSAPTSITAGVPFNVTVTAQDSTGARAYYYRDTVHFTSSDAQAMLPADYTFIYLDAAAHTFTLTARTKGAFTVTVTDTANGSIVGTAALTVNAAASNTVSTLSVTGFPTTATAGNSGSVTVKALDASGNVVTNYTGTVLFTASDGNALLPATYTFVSGDHGVHTFGVTFKTVGSQWITVTDTLNSSITGTQTGISVNSGAASILQVAGFPASDTAGVAGTLTVIALDLYGNIATGYRGAVTFGSSDAQAGLPGTYTFSASDRGVHAFQLTPKTAGMQTVTVQDAALSFIVGTERGITVSPAAAGILRVTGFPPTTTAGVGGVLTVTALDPYGNVATGYTGTVHFTSSDGQAALPGDYTFVAADGGVHTFTVTLKTAGTQSLTATDTATSSITGTQGGITVSPAAASTFTVSSFPASATAGVAGTFTVTAFDVFGNTATGYSGTVHFTSSDSLASLPADYTFGSADNGVQTFSATLNTGGSQSLTATDTTMASITGSQTGIAVYLPAVSFSVAGFPASTSAGSAGTVTVTALDANGNLAATYGGTVHFSSSDAQASLPADYTFTSADAGAHPFTVTLQTAGTQSLTATDTVTATITGTQSGITVTSTVTSTATSFSITGFPALDTAGTTGTVTVTALDGNGNTVAGYTGTVHFTSSDSQAVLPADYTFTSADAGVHTFSVTLKTAGSQSLTATDTTTASITGTQTGITVNPAAASTLIVSGFPAAATSGVAGSLTVTADDLYGNIATGYTGTVQFSSSDSQAVLPANYTFGSADAGVHTFSATLETSGSQSVTATDAATASITGTQTGITVYLAAVSFSVTGFPTSTTAGIGGNLTVTALDVHGQVAGGYSGTVHFSSSDGQAGLPADYTFGGADTGVHTFSATLKTAGTQSITATDTVTATITGAETGINVAPAAASSLTLNGYPSPIMAGVSGSLQVTAKDAYGNTASGYTGTIQFSSSDSRALLPANYTFTSTDQGSHTFFPTFKVAGTQSLTATDTVTASITGSQTGISVTAAAASTLAVNGFPSPGTAGTAATVTVTAKDGYGNTVTAYSGTVHFTSSDSQAVLPADYTFGSGDAGVHSFSLTLKTAGSQTLTATDTVTGSITGKQANITINAAAASTLIVSGFPSPVAAGTVGGLTVTAKDAYGNVATGYTGTVHLTSSDAKALLSADYTYTSSAKGVHVFHPTLKTAGSQSLTATDTVSSSITGTQSSITVTAATAKILKVTGFPKSIAHGSAASFTVTLVDAFGNVATGYQGTVRFTSSDGAAALPANYTFTSGDAGVHTFSATLNTTGTQSITATDTSSSSITGTESGIKVTAASPEGVRPDGAPRAEEVDDRDLLARAESTAERGEPRSNPVGGSLSASCDGVLTDVLPLLTEPWAAVETDSAQANEGLRRQLAETVFSGMADPLELAGEQQGVQAALAAVVTTFAVMPLPMASPSRRRPVGSGELFRGRKFILS
jgi:phosphodiesterase/alkaline phosphatase D-like protein